jgi:glyoxylase-like metal-dependent hydrolase (beta-lactamase superfamily II)
VGLDDLIDLLHEADGLGEGNDDLPVVSDLVDQLAKIGVKPEQIKYVGISHYHADHTGQVASFPGSTVLIGAKESPPRSLPQE